MLPTFEFVNDMLNSLMGKVSEEDCRHIAEAKAYFVAHVSGRLLDYPSFDDLLLTSYTQED